MKHVPSLTNTRLLTEKESNFEGVSQRAVVMVGPIIALWPKINQWEETLPTAFSDAGIQASRYGATHEPSGKNNSGLTILRNPFRLPSMAWGELRLKDLWKPSRGRVGRHRVK